jgi:hypothetical protein
MSLTNNQTRLQKNNTQVASSESTREFELYNLLFAGKITMKEYLRLVVSGMHREKTQH